MSEMYCIMDIVIVNRTAATHGLPDATNVLLVLSFPGHKAIKEEQPY